ncbi:hypothetical protein WJX73_008540 [Symbiochloris irregularis]|uniref:Uncharacterized protein n=1 Tax=Symbiochloris irregularis TaxID=706552 RepID=A0AAW1PW06_9CHLO
MDLSDSLIWWPTNSPLLVDQEGLEQPVLQPGQAVGLSVRPGDRLCSSAYVPPARQHAGSILSLDCLDLSPLPTPMQIDEEGSLMDLLIHDDMHEGHTIPPDAAESPLGMAAFSMGSIRLQSKHSLGGPP